MIKTDSISILKTNIVNFWSGLLAGRLISMEMVDKMPGKHRGDGADPGVSFISEYNPNKKIISVIVSNYCDGVWEIAGKIRL